MEKVLAIDGKTVPFRCTGSYLIRYKEATGRDPIKDLMRVSSIAEQGTMGDFDVAVLFDMIYILAKTADPGLPDQLTWLDGFDNFPIVTIFSDLQDLLTSAFGNIVPDETKPVKKNQIKR